MKQLLFNTALCCLVTTASALAHPEPSYFEKVVTAHGVLGSVAWVVLFPLGGILIRSFDWRHIFWVHTIIQLIAYTCFCFVFGSGIWFGWLYGSYNDAHVCIGIIVFGFASLQPFLGTIHHQRFKRYERRTFASILHIHLGRALVTVGIINGGLGLYLAGNATVGQIQAYGIIGGLVWLFYMVIVSFMEVRTTKDTHLQLERSKSMLMVEGSIEDRKFGIYE